MSKQVQRTTLQPDDNELYIDDLTMMLIITSIIANHPGVSERKKLFIRLKGRKCSKYILKTLDALISSRSYVDKFLTGELSEWLLDYEVGSFLLQRGAVGYVRYLDGEEFICDPIFLNIRDTDDQAAAIIYEDEVALRAFVEYGKRYGNLFIGTVVLFPYCGFSGIPYEFSTKNNPDNDVRSSDITSKIKSFTKLFRGRN